MLFEEEVQVSNYQRECWSDQLISQDILWPKVKASIQQGNFPHFSLILAKPGNGQLLLALGIAQSLMCVSDEKPCGVCDSCRKVNHLMHPDLHFSFPLNNSKETCQQYYNQWRLAIKEKPFMNITNWFTYLGDESKNANISVKEIDNFSQLLFLKPFESQVSVLILWLPEYLGKEANRLLKLFEEPPSNVYVILVTENSDLILPTVLSRAQVFRMQAIQLDEAADFLSNRFSFPRETAYAALISTDRNIQEASLQIEQQNLPSIEMLRKLLKSTYTYQLISMIEWVESFMELNKEEQKQFLQWIQLLLSFVLRIKYRGSDELELPDNPMIAYSTKLADSLSVFQIEEWVALLDDCEIAIQRNANMKILMTDYCIQLSKIVKTN